MKNKNLFKIILFVILFLFILFMIRLLITLGILTLIFMKPSKEISGIQNYNKDYYIKKYGGDLDSNLSIFPDDIDILKKTTFSSSFKESLFDSDGYILLISKFNKEDFDSEINRLSQLSMIIHDGCKKNSITYTNKVMYNEDLYKYPAYITIDGFDSTYEYALINKKELEIIYVYLSYPYINNSNYSQYLKLDKNKYLTIDTLKSYSMYNHSFDNGDSFSEFDDC